MTDIILRDTYADSLAALSAPFDPRDVKQRKQGGVMLDYVGIDATIRKLNDVLGTEWSFVRDAVTVTPLEGGKYACVVEGTMHALGKSAFGVGADVATDLDKALKTALAEALKKAGHQFGVGLYLWEASERDLLGYQRAALGGDITALKYLVFQRAVSEDAADSSTAEGIAAHFGVTKADLMDPEVLTRLAQL